MADGSPLPRKRPPPGGDGLSCVAWGRSDVGDVLRGRSRLPLHHVELHLVTLGERTEPAGLDGRVMDEAVLFAGRRGDEPEPLRVVEPLHRALDARHRTDLPLLSDASGVPYR